MLTPTRPGLALTVPIREDFVDPSPAGDQLRTAVDVLVDVPAFVGVLGDQGVVGFEEGAAVVGHVRGRCGSRDLARRRFAVGLAGDADQFFGVGRVRYISAWPWLS